MKVLVVDDENISLQLAEYTLRQAGYDVTVARDGCEALATMAGGQYHVVVADWGMPRMDGLELCRAIRSGWCSDYVYFILLTGKSGPQETLEGFQAGTDDYISKPYNPHELIMRVAIGCRIIGFAHTASRAKTQFLANMSHELRTPMTAILGYSELIASGCPGHCNFGKSELDDNLQTVTRNGRHLLKVIDDMLALSRCEVDSISVDAVWCSPQEVVSEAATLIQASAAAKKLTIDLTFHDDLPTCVRMDAARMRQILLHLFGNAVKFTERGGVRIDTAVVRQGGGQSLQVSVTDTGTGIEPEHLNQLFQPFSRVDSSMTRRHSGMGLGLAVSKRMAGILGGDITAVSELGKGSTFTLTVGLPTEGKGRSSDKGCVAEVPKTTLPRLPSLADCHVLVAEDGVDNQRIIALLLKKAGATVRVVENGDLALHEVLAKAKTERPYDVILMDMQMPIMDGYTATRQLREQGYAGPIIALTAHAMTEDRQKCLDAGCDDYTTKPIDRQRLLTTVAQWIASGQRNELSRATTAEGNANS